MYMHGQEGELMFRGLAIAQERALGPEDDYTLDTYLTLADILNERLKTEESEKLLKRILALNESKKGRKDVRTLGLQSSLVQTLFFQQRYSAAEDMARGLLSIMKECWESITRPPSPL
jgi:hypothetical protein